MGLDIGIGDAQVGRLMRNEPSIVFEDDGYYWYLHPFFEVLRAETGEYIDLYGGANFILNIPARV